MTFQLTLKTIKRINALLRLMLVSFWVKVIPDLWLQFISYWNPPLQPVRVESARHIERSVCEQARRAVWPIPELLYGTCSTDRNVPYPFGPSRAYLWQRWLTNQAWDRLPSNPTLARLNWEE